MREPGEAPDRVQMQPLVAARPRAADAVVPVENRGFDPLPLERSSRGQSGGARTDDHNL